MEGFSPASPPRIFWNSRKRSAAGRSLEKAMEEEESLKTRSTQPKESHKKEEAAPPAAAADHHNNNLKAAISERRRALFEPLQPPASSRGGGCTLAEVLLPPPDFETTSYPKGWLVGKKRKLVNVDVVESMRRIAIQEMNRKDREIDGLNEQLEEDARCLEHLQLQLIAERNKRADVERQNSVLQEQVSMLMNMLEEAEADGDDGASEDP